MEESGYNETVKQTLIIAGLTELEMHGVTDFSLRRVASNCNVSCAAPYRHFKDKQHLIDAIIKYIEDQWRLLCVHVLEIFDGDPKRQLVEMCIAFVRFCTGNSRYRTILLRNAERLSIKEDISSIVTRCFNDRSVHERVFKITALLIGGTMLTGDDTAQNELIIASLKQTLEKEIEHCI